MSKTLYKYVEYSCISNKPYVRYLSVNSILEIESEILKSRGLDPKENKLVIAPCMDDKNRFDFFWDSYSPFRMTYLRPGYIEKIDSDLDDVSGIFKNVDMLSINWEDYLND